MSRVWRVVPPNNHDVLSTACIPAGFVAPRLAGLGGVPPNTLVLVPTFSRDEFPPLVYP
jgi:hypothetical protein